MNKILKVIIVGISALLLTLPASAQEAAKEQGKEQSKEQSTALSKDQSKEQSKEQSKALSKEQNKGLDEQVQEIKTDVLGIATELKRLEEKLLYPSDTQVAIFVSVPQDEKSRLDSVSIDLDGRTVAQHLYTFKELEALKKGGVQRIYVGNARTGEHPLQVRVTGKSEGGSDYQKEESFKVVKGIGPKLVGVVLAGTGIGSKTITVKDW